MSDTASIDRLESTESPTLSARLGAAIAAVPSGRFDGEVTEKLKLCLLDFFACAFESSVRPQARQAAALAPAESGPCTIIGTPAHVAAADAGFANAVAGHGLVREDMHTGSVSHLGVAVLPGLLALAQDRRATGRAFATAAIIGYEVGARIGRAIITPEFARMFRPTGFTGPLASAAACAHLLGLDDKQIATALSLAANMTGGLNEWPATGADDMFFHPGTATRNGLVAARLADLGAYGAPRALDGEAGLLPNYRPDHSAPDVKLFAGDPEIMSVFFKPVPVCNFAQTPCLAALSIADRIEEPEAITSVEVAVTRAAKAYPGCDHAGPFERILQAKMSIHYAVASSILRRKVDEESYASLDDRELAKLASKISVTTDDDLTAAYPKKQGAKVTISFANGESLHAQMEDVMAADQELVRQRFRAAAAEMIGARPTETLESLVNSITDVDDMSDLMALASTKA
ncbi:MAG: MmgE/PrpD family protein [Hyphomicrobiaceae bacterium]|nr:MmgE/PrpD family protein [Hyphomicrobiaceae bacterium]MCC0025252.1 MmgE/PrpD family protein [Hyphomicrobiaceae bacterium]